MVKNHLKRVASPKSWDVLRKNATFISKPLCGAHSFNLSLSLNSVFKEMIKVAKTTKEVKRMLHKEVVLVDGTRRHDEKHNTGFMDVISFPLTKQSFRMSLNKMGKLVCFPIASSEADKKLVKIRGKNLLKGGKVQLSFTDGRTMIVKKDEYNTKDSLLISLPGQKIIKSFQFKLGSFIMVIGGKYAGFVGTLKSIENNDVLVQGDGKEIHTKARNVFVLGDKKSEIACSE